MADIKISELNTLAEADVDAANDVLPIVDDGATETKKVTPEALIKGSGGMLADGSTPLSGNLILDGNSIVGGTFSGSITGSLDLFGSRIRNGFPLYVSSSLETGTTYTLSETNHNNYLLFSGSAGALVTVPGSLPVGVQAVVVQYGDHQVTFTGSTGADLVFPSESFQTGSAEKGSSIVFTVVRTNEILVSGDLEIFPVS